MSFDLKISLDDGGAASTLDKVTSGLENTENASKRATGGMTELATALGLTTKASAATASGADRVTEALDRVGDRANKRGVSIDEYLAFSQGAMDRTLAGIDSVKASLSKMYPQSDLEAQVHSLDALLVQSQISVEQYDAQISKLYAALGKSGAGTPLSDELKAQDDMLKSIKGPAQQYATQMTALENLFAQGKINAAEFDTTLARLNQKFGAVQGSGSGGMSSELERQAQIFQRINAPMLEYEAQLKALDALLKQDKISLTDYNRELERAEAAARKGAGPIQGPQRPGAEPAGGGGGGGNELGNALQAVAPQLGQGGQLLSQFASGGTLAAAATVGLALELAHLGDEYTTLANKVERYATSTQSANSILHELEITSRDLHGDLKGTEELYVRIRESTTELNLSRQQQLNLTKDIGVAVAAEGRSVEDAASLTRRLSLAFSSGTISGRELRSIMREYPEILDGWVATMGRTRQEMMQMASKGEISAQQIIDAFHKMAPEAERTLDRMHETLGQKAGHMWDSVSLTLGNGIDNFLSLDEDPAKKVSEQFDRARHAAVAAQRQLASELEKNARTGDIVNAALGVGVDLGPFNKKAADTITETRMEVREAGIDMADAYENVKAKAQLYGTEIDKIKEQHSAKAIADDAKRIYDAMYGVDDIMKKGFDHWRDLADTISTATKAIERWKSLTPAGVPTSQEQRDLELEVKNAKTEQNTFEYGSGIVTYAKGLNNAKAELEAFSRAQHDGVIQGEAARQKYDALMTTLNDGRLPEAIKIWEGIHLPIEQFGRDIRALDALFASSRVTLEQYNLELHKLEDAHFGADVMAILRPVTNPKPYKPGTEAVAAQAHEADVAHDSLVGTKVADLEKEYKFQIPPDLSADIAAWDKRAEAINANLKEIDPLLYAQKQHELMLQEERKILDQLNGPPIKQYELGLKAAGDLLEHGKVDADQYAKAVDDVRAAYLAASSAGKTFVGGMELEWLKMKQGADAFGASVAKVATGGFDKLNDALLDTVNNSGKYDAQRKELQAQFAAGKISQDEYNKSVQQIGVNWGNVANSVIEDLERIALKMLEVKLIQAGLSLFGGGEGAAIGAAAGALGGGSAPDDLVGNSGGGLPGYATGGSWMVGGAGGADSQTVAFRASPWERVTVSPAGAYPWPSGGSGPGAAAQPTAQPAPVNKIYNIIDSSMTLAAVDSRQGNQAVLNVLRANGGAVRSYSGTRR